MKKPKFLNTQRAINAEVAWLEANKHRLPWAEASLVEAQIVALKEDWTEDEIHKFIGDPDVISSALDARHWADGEKATVAPRKTWAPLLRPTVIVTRDANS